MQKSSSKELCGKGKMGPRYLMKQVRAALEADATEPTVHVAF